MPAGSSTATGPAPYTLVIERIFDASRASLCLKRG
jgi:hypothetical protein